MVVSIKRRNIKRVPPLRVLLWCWAISQKFKMEAVGIVEIVYSLESRS